MILHANAIPKNRPTRIRAGGINCDDPDCAVLLAIVIGQLIHQRALASAGRTGKPQNPRMSSRQITADVLDFDLLREIARQGVVARRANTVPDKKAGS